MQRHYWICELQRIIEFVNCNALLNLWIAVHYCFVVHSKGLFSGSYWATCRLLSAEIFNPIKSGWLSIGVSRLSLRSLSLGNVGLIIGKGTYRHLVTAPVIPVLNRPIVVKSDPPSAPDTFSVSGWTPEVGDNVGGVSGWTSGSSLTGVRASNMDGARYRSSIICVYSAVHECWRPRPLPPWPPRPARGSLRQLLDRHTPSRPLYSWQP